MINRLYAYMHDIFGAEVIELFDMQYDPEEKYQRKEKKETEQNAEQSESGQTDQKENAESEQRDTETPKS